MRCGSICYWERAKGNKVDVEISFCSFSILGVQRRTHKAMFLKKELWGPKIQLKPIWDRYIWTGQTTVETIANTAHDKINGRRLTSKIITTPWAVWHTKSHSLHSQKLWRNVHSENEYSGNEALKMFLGISLKSDVATVLAHEEAMGYSGSRGIHV